METELKGLLYSLAIKWLCK